METQVTTCQCPACTGPIQYSEKTGQLECEYCGSSFTPEQIDASYARKEKETAEQIAREDEKKSWDYSGLSDDWGDEGEDLLTYSCPSCGAQLICEQTTAATQCPYCGNPTIIPGKFEGSLRPDHVIPFGITKDQAIGKLKDYFRGKIFLPNPFTAEHTLEKIQGVYVPFWLFDGSVSGDARYHATRTDVRRQGNEEITTTRHYMVFRGGELGFEKVPVDGSRKMSDEHMDAIEPYDYSQLKPFSTAYLPGFLADKYDVTAQDSRKRADARCENSFDIALQSTILGYDSVIPQGRNVRLERGRVQYALLPVWLLHVKWQEQDYLFAVNGQTGKLAGNLPVCRIKLALTFAILTGIFGTVGSILLPMLLG